MSSPCSHWVRSNSPLSLRGEWQSPHIPTHSTRYLPCSICAAVAGGGLASAAPKTVAADSKATMMFNFTRVDLTFGRGFDKPKWNRVRLLEPSSAGGTPAGSTDVSSVVPDAPSRFNL